MFGPYSIGLLVICGLAGLGSINSKKLSLLLVTPASRLTATHFTFHRGLAMRMASNESVEKVILLGIYESDEDKVAEEAKSDEKLTIWMRKIQRDPKLMETEQNTSAPISNPWRKRERFELKYNEDEPNFLLDFLLYNDHLMSELRAQEFDIACWEQYNLHGLHQAIFHALGIEHFCLTSPVPMGITSWDLYGLKRIVSHVPGLDLARIGDHLKVKVYEKKKIGDKEIYRRNKMQIDTYTEGAHISHKIWQEKLTLMGKQKNRKDLTDLAENLPTFDQLFERTRLYIVNHHPIMDYSLVEEEVKKLRDHQSQSHLPKLHFIAGLGMLNDNEGKHDLEPIKLDKETQEIFDKGPVVLVGFGSVIDLGIHTKSSLQDAKRALANLQNGPNANQNVAKIEETKKLVQSIEDRIAKETTLLEVLAKFQGKLGFPNAQFIVKYGPKEVKEYKKLGNDNVHGIGWVAQKAILSQGPEKVRAFISHCGMNSAIEAVHMGIPLICIPFFGDQLNNSEALASRGVAKVVDFNTYEKEKNERMDVKRNKDINEQQVREIADSKFKKNLTNALQEILSNSRNKYAKNMAEMQHRFNALKPGADIQYDLEELAQGKCPQMPIGLKGQEQIEKVFPSMGVLEQKHPEVGMGGCWKPQVCFAQQRVALMIPFRDRSEHLRGLLNHIHAFLQHQQADYCIFVIEQAYPPEGMPQDKFNKAKLLNAGFREVIKMNANANRRPFDCFIFNDVDLVPENEHNLYRCNFQLPKRLMWSRDKEQYVPLYKQFFGGVVALTREQYMQINGFSNYYWGWGLEDDDMSIRIRNGSSFKRFEVSTREYGTFADLELAKESSDVTNPKHKGECELILVASILKRKPKDGLNTVANSYKLKHVDQKKLFTEISVDLKYHESIKAKDFPCRNLIGKETSNAKDEAIYKRMAEYGRK